MTLLQEYREEKGLSKVAVAKELGVSDSTVHSWEKGTAVPSVRLAAEFLAVEIENILFVRQN